MDNKKNNDNTKNYIFAITVLSVLLALSLTYNFLGGFSFRNTLKNSFVVGDDYLIKMDEIGSKTVSFAVDGASLPGTVIKHKIQVVLPNLEVDNLILRAKITINNEMVQIFGFDGWELNEQKSYYNYNNGFFKNQTIGLCDEIKLGENLSLKSNIIYFMNVTVELFYQDGLTE
ncbi:MAG: hypothetical protein J6Q51_01880 [Clostridia bacterium]|nr:hypothetical protein [Clostridia bacterium]